MGMNRCAEGRTGTISNMAHNAITYGAYHFVRSNYITAQRIVKRQWDIIWRI